MKNNKKFYLSILISLLLILLIVLIPSIYFLIDTDSDDIKESTHEYILKFIPNSNVSIGNIKFKIGLSSQIIIENILVTLKTKGDDINFKTPTKLFNLEQLHFKIPFSSLLLGQGKIELSIDSPTLYNLKNKEIWHQATSGKDFNSGLKELQQTSKFNQHKFIGLILNNKLTLKLNNLILDELNTNNERIQFSFPKIILKKNSFFTPLSFEVNSDIAFLKPNSSFNSFSFQSQIIGEIPLFSILQKSDFQSSLIIKLDNFQFPGLSNKILGPIISTIEYSYNFQKKEFSGKEFLDLGFLGYFKSQILSNKRHPLHLTNIESKLYLNKFLSTFTTIKNQSLMEVFTPPLSINGSLELNTENFIHPELFYSLNTNPQISTSLPQLSGQLFENNFILNFKGINENDSSNYGVNSNIIFDPNLLSLINFPHEHTSKLQHISISTNCYNLNIDKTLLKKIDELYNSLKESENTVLQVPSASGQPLIKNAILNPQTAPPSEQEQSSIIKKSNSIKLFINNYTNIFFKEYYSNFPFLLKYFNQIQFKLSSNDISLISPKGDPIDFQFNTNMLIKENYLKSKDTTLSWDNGSAEIDFETTFKDQDIEYSSINFTITPTRDTEILKSFHSIDSLFNTTFLPSSLPLSGLISGKFTYHFDLGNKSNQIPKSNLAFDLSLKEINFSNNNLPFKNSNGSLYQFSDLEKSVLTTLSNNSKIDLKGNLNFQKIVPYLILDSLIIRNETIPFYLGGSGLFIGDNSTDHLKMSLFQGKSFERKNNPPIVSFRIKFKNSDLYLEKESSLSNFIQKNNIFKKANLKKLIQKFR